MKTLEYRISGRVQGVGYRYHTHAAALRIGICGYVRNEADGSVTVVAQGTDAQHQALRDHLRHGSPWAKVRDIRTRPADDTETFRDFAIRY